jgi:4-hydroxybenzoate polyprenyltransferase
MARLRSYAQLLRIPNVFTALADIGMAALATGSWSVSGSVQLWGAYGLLFLASASLYCGGMVWNDIFDLEQDREERPFRPLPSGAVERRAALRLGVFLLTAGIGLSALAVGLAGEFRWQPLLVALILAATILLYDGWLKRTWAGPVAMGACRFLNVLLGLSLVLDGLTTWGCDLALAVGVYIAGVTWFARTEARISNQQVLLAAALVMGVGLLLAVPVQLLAAGREPPPTSSPLFLYLLVIFGFVIGIPVGQAIRRPLPSRVQAAVKTAVLGLVGFDAILATALAGVVGLVLLVLLPPALYLGRWVYST